MVTGVTTEWDDIQVKMGNYTPHEKVASNDEVAEEQMEMLERYDNKLVMNDQQLKEECEDDLDFDEDDFMKDYRAKRLAQMQDQATKPKFGCVYEITKQDWEQHITRAPEGVWVVVVLYQNQ